MNIEKINPAEGAAGDISKHSIGRNLHTENLGNWQHLGAVATEVVENLSARREAWLIRRFRVSPEMAHAIMAVAFQEVRP